MNPNLDLNDDDKIESNIWGQNLKMLDNTQDMLNHGIETGGFVLEELDRQRTVMDRIRERIGLINEDIGQAMVVLNQMKMQLIKNKFKIFLIIVLLILLIILGVVVSFKFL